MEQLFKIENNIRTLEIDHSRTKQVFAESLICVQTKLKLQWAELDSIMNLVIRLYLPVIRLLISANYSRYLEKPKDINLEFKN